MQSELDVAASAAVCTLIAITIVVHVLLRERPRHARLEMETIAEEAGVPPSRVNFTTAMRFIRDEWAWCAVASPGSIPAKLRRMRDNVLDFVLPERRRQRRFPRAVKIKMSNYARKRRPSVPKAPAE